MMNGHMPKTISGMMIGWGYRSFDWAGPPLRFYLTRSSIQFGKDRTRHTPMIGSNVSWTRRGGEDSTRAKWDVELETEHICHLVRTN